MIWHTTNHNNKNHIPWLSILLVSALLCQALLPTVAYTHARSNPQVWDEICGMYGVGSKQTIPAADTKKVSAPASSLHHPDCPLCLNIIQDTVLHSLAATPGFHLLLITELSYVVPATRHFILSIATAVARGPPVSD